MKTTIRIHSPLAGFSGVDVPPPLFHSLYFIPLPPYSLAFPVALIEYAWISQVLLGVLIKFWSTRRVSLHEPCVAFYSARESGKTACSCSGHCTGPNATDPATIRQGRCKSLTGFCSIL